MKNLIHDNVPIHKLCMEFVLAQQNSDIDQDILFNMYQRILGRVGSELAFEYTEKCRKILILTGTING